MRVVLLNILVPQLGPLKQKFLASPLLSYISKKKKIEKEKKEKRKKKNYSHQLINQNAKISFNVSKFSCHYRCLRG